jgi:hypothetical protein
MGAISALPPGVMPVPGAFAFLQKLLNAGWKVVVFTSRMSGANPDQVEAALRDWSSSTILRQLTSSAFRR